MYHNLYSKTDTKRDINQKGDNVTIIMSCYKSYLKKKHCTYIAYFVLKKTRIPPFLFNLCRNKRTKINIFQVIEDQYIFMEMNGVE